MKIHNVRLGFATNSSSTHSIVVLPRERREGITDSEDAISGDFGWNYFTAASYKTKRLYLATLLKQELAGMHPDILAAVTKSWLGVNVPEGGAYIDHQSVISLPSGDGLKPFFAELRDLVLRDDVVVLGGNDNDGREHPAGEGGTAVARMAPLDSTPGSMRARKDGDVWSFFDVRDGTKVRFCLDKDAPKVTKASAPELVDLKITDKCPFNCAFCYQGSTATAKHGATYEIFRVIDMLRKWGTFEIAVGGGEPTLHPEFPRIIQHIVDAGMVPNFTTKNLAWLREPVAREILSKVGGVAFSVEKDDEIGDIVSMVNTLRGGEDAYYWLNKINIQCVMGVIDSYAMYRIYEETSRLNVRLTLLGYKQDGRGSSVKPVSTEGWVKELSALRDNSPHSRGVSIDTALAKKHEAELKAAGFDDILFETEEGKFSAYIDAVDGFMAASSFESGLKKRVELGNTAEEDAAPRLLETFRQW